MDETLAVVRLVLADALRRTLATTDPVESAFSATRRVRARVRRSWDGEMRRRWCVAGRLRALGKFRRVKGHRALVVCPNSIGALIGAVLCRRAGNGSPPLARPQFSTRHACQSQVDDALPTLVKALEW